MRPPESFATWREIAAQPAIWAGWAGALPVADLRDWIAAQGTEEVWFCGAGSSAYLGDILCAGLALGRFRAVPTTDIVSTPRLLAGRRPLVVSFGRSGNSAETIGTLDALDALAPGAPRLAITCNAQGALARRGPGRAVVLPEATQDAGFAMTSSFTTMLLTACALFAPEGAGGIARAGAAGAAAFPAIESAARALPVPERVVFLGTGPLAYAARESALKVMELTAGRVPALWESTLGFRHGPKSFVRGATTIVLLTSPEAHAARYEADLAAELRAQFPAATVLTCGPGGAVDLPMPDGPLWGAALAVVLAQHLAVLWSAALGLDADDPFAGQGTLTRVVSGVRLHPVAP